MNRLLWKLPARVRRLYFKAWLLAVNGPDDQPRDWALRWTQFMLSVRAGYCARFGHRMKPMGPLSGRTICSRCWQHQEGEDTPHDRKEHYLSKKRVADLMRAHGYQTDIDKEDT